jgi:peptidoglycan/xylan/chitin deacetylase (PgdA/CDA1 family)
MDPPRWRPTPFLLGSAAIHAAGVLAALRFPQHAPAAAATVFANHLALAAATLWPKGLLLGPNLTRLPADAARQGEVALTFDDGPDPAVTPEVLELLSARSARATFFCIGRRAEVFPDIAAEAVRRGHTLENHTWSHPNAFACYPPAAMRRQIRQTQEALEKISGRTPRFFRAPAGFRNFLLEPELLRLGLTLASWTRRGYDTVSRDPAAVSRRLLENLKGGDVLLLHDGSAARDHRGRPVVLEVLPRLLDELAARGLRAVPLPMEGAREGKRS